MSVNELQDGRDEAPLETSPEIKALMEETGFVWESVMDYMSDDLMINNQILLHHCAGFSFSGHNCDAYYLVFY